jgi:acetyl esterase/lipase
MLDGAAKRLARVGYVVFNVNYSLAVAGRPGYPMQVGDVRAAVRWVEQNAARFGGDPTRIGLAGSSAGAYLVAMVATTSPRPSPLRAVVSLSGPMDLGSAVEDLEALRSSPLCPAGSCAEFDRAVSDLRALTGCMPLRCSKDLLQQASPISHVTEDCPPFYLANSSQERVPLAQAQEMEARLRAAGVPVELVVPSKLEHGVRYVNVVSGSVLSFLDRNLARTAPAPAADGSDEPPTRERRRPWVVPGLLALLAAVVGGLGFTVTRVRTSR